MSSSFFLKQTDYSWNNALLWGNSIGHFKKCRTGTLWKRPVHLIVALAEAVPIVGQIISIFETAIYKTFVRKSPVEQNKSSNNPPNASKAKNKEKESSSNKVKESSSNKGKKNSKLENLLSSSLGSLTNMFNPEDKKSK